MNIEYLLFRPLIKFTKIYKNTYKYVIKIFTYTCNVYSPVYMYVKYKTLHMYTTYMTF